MKYGKYLAKRQLDIPEYSNYFMNYKALKKVIKSLSAPAGTPREIEKTLQDNKATFFFRVERELEKVNSFYLQKEAELKLRLEILCEKKNTAYSTGSLFSKASLSFITLHEGFQRFLRDLDKLEQFIELNATGFSKVLKKWDKRSKSQTKELYLSRAVEVQPVFHREELAEMSDLASASILELEAWADGESVIFEGKGSTTTDKERQEDNINIPLEATQNNPQDSHQDQADRLHPQYNGYSRLSQGNVQSSSSASDSKATDELYHEFIKTASSTATENTPQVLADWISRLSQLDGAKERITSIFLLAIPTKASDAALIALYNSGYIDIHSRDEINGQTVLHKACISGRTTIVDLALKENVNPKVQDTYGRTALHYACLHNHVNLISKLVNKSDSILDALDKDNFSPLLCSIITKHSSCVRILIDLGANTNAGDAEKFYIPLNFACQYGVYDAAKMILEQSAKDINEKENLHAMRPDAEGLYPIHIAARAGHSQLIKLLTSYNANVNEVDKLNKWTALFYAASEGHSQTVHELIEAEAIIDILDEEGHSPLYYATWEGHVRSMEHLSKALIKAQLRKEKDKGANEGDSENLVESLGNGITSSSPLDHSRPIPINGSTVDDTTSVSNGLASFSNADIDSVLSSTFSPNDDVMMDIEGGDIEIPDLSLPPPILPLRRYGHNFLDKKIFVQLIFDASPSVSSSSFSAYSSFNERNSHSSTISSPASITSAASDDFDPPSIPGSKPIEFDKGDDSMPAGRLTIASRSNHDIIPQNIILPFSDSDRIVSFQVDSLENFAIDFEIYPTYGTRIVAKTAALPYIFNNPNGYKSTKSNKNEYPETLGTRHYCTLPLFDMRLHTVGKLNFAFQIVRPFSGKPLEITKFDTYWKSTSQVKHQQQQQTQQLQQSFSTLAASNPVASIISKTSDSSQSQVQLLLQSQGSNSPIISTTLSSIISGNAPASGSILTPVSTTAISQSIPIPAASSISNIAPSSLSSNHQFPSSFSSHHLSASHHTSLHPSATSVSSQSLSFVTASSLSGSFARIKVCLTKDKIPVVVPFWTINVAHGIELPIGNLDLSQLVAIASNSHGSTASSVDYEEESRKRVASATTPEAVYSAVSQCILPLSDFLSSSPVDLKLDICVLYPTFAESLYTNLGISSFPDLNEYVDKILAVLFDHVREVRARKKNGHNGVLFGGDSGSLPTRNVIFSSSHPDVCTVLNWKQPNYPVFFQVSGIEVNTNMLREIAASEEQENQSQIDGGEGVNTSTRSACSKGCFRLVSAHSLPVPETDRRCISLKDAAAFASNNNLLGLICSSNLLSLVPSLVATIRVFGLVLVSETTESDDNKNQQAVVQGVDGTRTEKVLKFKGAIDM